MLFRYLVLVLFVVFAVVGTASASSVVQSWDTDGVYSVVVFEDGTTVWRWFDEAGGNFYTVFAYADGTTVWRWHDAGVVFRIVVYSNGVSTRVFTPVL